VIRATGRQVVAQCGALCLASESLQRNSIRAAHGASPTVRRGSHSRVLRAIFQDLMLAAPAGPRANMDWTQACARGQSGHRRRDGETPRHRHGVSARATHDWNGTLAALALLASKQQRPISSASAMVRPRVKSDKLAAADQKAPRSQAHGKIVVSEAGASVYSASELAQGFPNLDVSLARRRLDRSPLCRIRWRSWSRSIQGHRGWPVQHDVSQSQLAKSNWRRWSRIAVNAVGVDVNMASRRLARKNSGLSATLAEKHRALSRSERRVS